MYLCRTAWRSSCCERTTAADRIRLPDRPGQVRDYWTRQWAEIDSAVEPLGFRREQDGRVAVAVRQVVRDLAGTVIAEGRVTHVYRFADGLVRDMEIRS